MRMDIGYNQTAWSWGVCQPNIHPGNKEAHPANREKRICRVGAGENLPISCGNPREDFIKLSGLRRARFKSHCWGGVGGSKCLQCPASRPSIVTQVYRASLQKGKTLVPPQDKSMKALTSLVLLISIPLPLLMSVHM